MDLTTTIDARVRVTAALESDGLLSVKVFASSEYAKGRTATASMEGVEIPAALQNRLAAVLQEVLEATQAPLGQRLSRSLVKAHDVAAQMGELR